MQIWRDQSFLRTLYPKGPQEWMRLNSLLTKLKRKRGNTMKILLRDLHIVHCRFETPVFKGSQLPRTEKGQWSPWHQQKYQEAPEL
jgi:hypothetical protein